MKKHPTEVPGYEGELETLAHHINAMRYDQVIAFYEHSLAELRAQATSDRARGRMQLAAALDAAADGIQSTIDDLTRAWRISKPYMKEEMDSE